jgi:S1-C subfamily serine protease
VAAANGGVPARILCGVEPDDADDVDDVGPFDEAGAFATPPPPDDRLWRHPSELSAPAAVSKPASRPARHRWTTVMLAAAAGSLGTMGVLAVAGALDVRESNPREPIVYPAVSTVGVPVADPLTSMSNAKSALASVVRIEVVGASSAMLGSGVLFSADGHVLTNAHVVKGAEAITVVLADGRRISASVVGADDETDIAVVQLAAGGPFPVAKFGSLQDLTVGESAMVVGASPLVGGTNVTAGKVSALGREVHSESGLTLLDMIQTDATVAPGASGGALIDAQGRVIGICTAYSLVDGQPSAGYATPVEVARAVATDLVEDGTYEPGWLGVRGVDRSEGGVTLVEVLGGSPAAAAGLQPGDVVMAVDKEPTTDMSAMRVAMRVRQPGDKVTISYARGGQVIEAHIALAPRPATT